MAWVESHTVLIRHRKLLQLAAALSIEPVVAMGHLHALWHAILEQQEDGNLAEWPDEMIASAAAFKGDPHLFVTELQSKKWLDGKIVHDWLDYAGRYLTNKYRTANPRRLKAILRLHRVRLKSDSSLSKVRPKSDNHTLPNHTLPNHTLQNQKKDIVSQRETAHEILTFLNQKTGKAFRPVSANLDLILARLKEGATAQNCRMVIARKRMDWGDDPKMVQYLRPATLFNKIKFAQYLGECVIPPEDQSDDTPPAVKELTHAMRTV